MKKMSLQHRLKLSQATTNHYKRPGAKKALAEAQLKKLSPRDFNRIFKDKRPNNVIAAQFGVSVSYVSAIKNRKRGQHHITIKEKNAQR